MSIREKAITFILGLAIFMYLVFPASPERAWLAKHSHALVSGCLQQIQKAMALHQKTTH